MATLTIDEIINRVRDRLRAEKIHVWEAPYLIGGEPQDDALEELGRNYAFILQLPTNATIAAVKELQNSAVDKLLAIEKFRDTGIASLKVKIPSEGRGTTILNIGIKLTATGRMLRDLLAEKSHGVSDKIKLIAHGKILLDEVTLEEQGVKNNQQLMALIVTSAVDEELSIYERVKKIKADAKLLNLQSFLTLENQDGSPIYLPNAERAALTVGLALYEKGRVALNRENYTEALVLFLEADEEFKLVQSKLLESVDNYALLNLDIVWCYLRLKSITQLPDAERRLKACEDSFRRSYGTDFDRVSALKGGNGSEKALIMRLHLLQAILCFHMNRLPEAQGLLLLAESELNPLKVDDQNITVLVSMGYTEAEARIGLRAGRNSIERAITEITQRREAKMEAKKKAKMDRKFIGNYKVNPEALKQLIDMGYQKEVAAMALEKTENLIESAVTMLQDDFDTLEKDLMNRASVNVFEQFLSKLIEQGFTAESSRQALELCANDLEKAIEFLTKDTEEGATTETTSDAAGPSSTPTDPGPSSSTKALLDKAKRRVDQKRHAEEALERFQEDFNHDEDDYLNLPLVQEEQLIQEYKRFMNL